MAIRQMGHAPQLDGIRALAVAIVFLSHAGLGKIFPGGFGVTVFFFLSGFLITSLLRSEFQQTGRIDFGGFYLRRTLRIVPPLYITLLVAYGLVLAGWVTPEHPVDPWAIPAQFFFLQNYADLWGHPHGIPVTGIWSLAVEEHFYLLFPAVFVLFLARRPGWDAAMACLLVCILVLGVRLLNAHFLPSPEGNYHWTHTRIDSLLFGCILALWNNPLLDERPWKPSFPLVLVAGLAVMGAQLSRDPIFRETYRYTIQGVGLFVLFSYALQAGGLVKWALSHPVAGRTALYSYSAYLVHIPLILAVDQNIPAPAPVRFALALALTWAYAALMYRLVERPAAGLRRTLHERAKARLALATTS